MRIGALACWTLPATAAVGVSPCSAAQGSNVDWKLYGSAHVDGENMCFFDAKGVVRSLDGHIRVWTKCLPQKRLDQPISDDIAKLTAAKLVDKYVPPIAMIEKMNPDQWMAITAYEVTADVNDIQPKSRILYDLDCDGQMIRELSLYAEKGGKEVFTEKPGAWEYVAPETNAARLSQILCPSQ